MRDPGEFDAFYEESRGRLLLQAYALTGDLPAARSAVRDAFVAAWHHWAKVAVLDDPESWVRPHAWRHAQRRHQARPWHREKSLTPDARATLEALRKLSVPRRKALLLTQLSTVDTAQMAREVGLTAARAAEELDAASTQLADALQTSPEMIRPRLEALVEQLDEIHLPDASVIRRNGTTRRRTHTAVGVLLCISAVFGAGAAVHATDGQAPLLGGGKVETTAPQPEARLMPADLLERDQISTALAPRTASGAMTIDDNTGDDGRYAVCQAKPFAAPDGLGALVREVSLAGKPKANTVQSVELAKDATSAHSAYLRMRDWFSTCEEARVQLLSTHDLTGVGDEGMLLTLRSWEAPVTTHQVAVARTGTLITLILVNTRGKAEDEPKPIVKLSAAAITQLCNADVGADTTGACVTKPRAVRVTPPAALKAPGMLQVLDLPPMPGAPLPWVGVKPSRPTTNAAATRCDNASFLGKPITKARTRTFVIPGADLPSEFGVTETLGRFPSGKAAKKFVEGVRAKMASCPDRDLATTVEQTGQHTAKGEELTTWHVETEVSETKTTIFRMGIVRLGSVVAQVGFTSGSDRTLAEGGFSALTVRALRRLENLPAS